MTDAKSPTRFRDNSREGRIALLFHSRCRSLLIGVLALGALASCHFVGESAFAVDDPLANCNVVWNSPSKDQSGSMPIGNGEMGMNVWVEPSGDLVFLCGRTDSWNENMDLLKIGRVRIKFTPSLATGSFRQTLRLRQGEIEIQGGPDDAAIKVHVWPDCHHQVAWVEAASDKPFHMQVAIELWRNNDTVLAAQNNRIVWYHCNPTSMWRSSLELQRLPMAIESGKDPLLHRTFGGLIEGKGLVCGDNRTLKTAAPGRHFCVAMHTHTMTPATGAQWLSAIEKNAAEVESLGIERIRAAHRQWWDQFWNRSWIRASGTLDAEVATQSYVLQRFITAGAGRGHYPINSNGSLFTVNCIWQNVVRDPDFRNWGPCYWFQNTRLCYWPMMASGDFDMMRPLFRMFEDAMPLARIRNKVYFNHEGCFFPETITFFGAYENGEYGWGGRKDGKPGDPIPNRYVRYHYNNTLELLAMMLDYYTYTEDKEFFRKELLPIADEYLVWWAKHWPRDAAGKLAMLPSNALETYWDAANPAQDIAGLQWNLDRLLAFSDEEIGATRRTRWNELRKAVPALPTMIREKKRVLAPALEPLPPRTNSENPELYSIFPFRLYGVGKPDLQLALDTFNTRLTRVHDCWRQDDTQAALLGQAAVARDFVGDRAKSKTTGSRFPAFWGPNNDWIPDIDHGGNLLMAMQTMLVQADGGRIHVLPAWPKDWDVAFKLCAPQNTTVEGTVRAGKLITIKVLPEQRKDDLVLHRPQ